MIGSTLSDRAAVSSEDKLFTCNTTKHLVSRSPIDSNAYPPDYPASSRNWLFVMRPYMVSQVRPYVLSPEAERALQAGGSFRECAKNCPEIRRTCRRVHNGIAPW